MRVDEAPAFGVGKYTTAWDMTSLWRALWLASGGLGPLRDVAAGTDAGGRPLPPLAHRARPRPAEARHRRSARTRGVGVLHKAGWISASRHDTGLVFWKGGVFVAGVMTWRSWGVSTRSDRLAGRVAALDVAALAAHRRVTSAVPTQPLP